MKILITSGGTSEKIDDVRKITNLATGRLGSLIADEFIKKANVDITYVCGENAIVPSGAVTETIRIGTVSELFDTLTTLLKHNKFTAVIHAMAVSDYCVRGFLSIEELSLSIAAAIHKNGQFFSNSDSQADIIKAAILQSSKTALIHRKISSGIANPVLFMDKTPKIISIIKRLQPETILVGFKLLAGVNEDVLLHTGHELLVKNDCDFVLANDMEKIKADKHEGILIEKDRTFSRLYSKQDIAEAIASKVFARIKESGN